MAEIDVYQIMNSIPDYFDAEKAQGVSGLVQCSFSGEQASEWVIRIHDQTCTVEQGTTSNPDLTIKADAKDGVKLLTGQLDPMRAYMLGKIKGLWGFGIGNEIS